ncbi:MAG: hypothetical protein AB7P04_01340 [Bacteriovoracia bacterium]
MQNTPKHVHGSAILVGSAIGLALHLAFATLGAALGFFVLDLVRGETPSPALIVIAAVFAVLSLSLSFFVAAYVTVRLSRVSAPFDARMHGLACWAVILLVAGLAFSRGASAIGGLLATAGLGAGSVVTVGSVLKEINDLKPRIVTDLKVFQGKAVTTFETGPIGAVGEKVVDSVKQDVNELATQSADKLNRALMIASWLIACVILLGGFAAVYGGHRAALRGPVSEVRSLVDRGKLPPRKQL